MTSKSLKISVVFMLSLFAAIFSLNSADADQAKSYRFNYSDNEDIARYHSPNGKFSDTPLSYLSKSIISSNKKSPPPPPVNKIKDPYFNSKNSWGQGYEDLWGLKKINADDVWNYYKGKGVTIAVVDTGVQLNHEDIASNIWRNNAELYGRRGFDDDGNGFVDDYQGWDFVDNDNTPNDLMGHGTHVAGIAASPLNEKGIAGVAPLAKIMPVRVLDAYGSGTFAAIAQGIRYAAKAGANIINLSLGSYYVDDLPGFTDAIKYAQSLGSIVVAAAGNYGWDSTYFYPAGIEGVIAVGATDYYDNTTYWSNYGSNLAITAPGLNILSLGSPSVHIGNAVASKYYYASGTSMSTPFVSGAIALLLNKYPTASLQDIRNLLAAGAVDLGPKGWDPNYGYGRLDIAASLGITSNVTINSAAGAASASTIRTTTQTSSQSQSAVVNEIFEKQNVLQSIQDDRREIENAGASLVQENIYQESLHKNTL